MIVEIKNVAIEGVVEVDLGNGVSQQGRAHVRINHLQKCNVKCVNGFKYENNMVYDISSNYLQI